MDNKKLKKVIKDYYNKKENITLSDENIRIFFNDEEKHKIFIIECCNDGFFDMFEFKIIGNELKIYRYKNCTPMTMSSGVINEDKSEFEIEFKAINIDNLLNKNIKDKI